MKTKHPCLQPVSAPWITHNMLPIIPCGKCPNCLKRKGSELAFRLYRQLNGRRVHFLTFTYDDEHCPIQRVTMHFDSDAAVYSITENVIRWPEFFQLAKFTWQRNKKGYRCKRFEPIEHTLENNVFDGPRCTRFVTYYPTVYYEDIKDMLKRFRSKSDALTDYICVPEYGGASYRPHYHMLVCGFSQADIDLLVSEWTYGSVDVRRVVALSKQSDEATAMSAVSNYVAKYATKGKYDCPYIEDGYCKKPRRAVSTNFGCGDSLDDLKRVFYRHDLYPGYNPLTDGFPTSQSDDFSLQTARELAESFLLYRSVNINGYGYPLPDYLKKKLFYNNVVQHDESGKVIYRGLQACPLQKAVTAVLLDRISSDFVREQRQMSGPSALVSFDFDDPEDRIYQTFANYDSGLQSADLRRAEQAFCSLIESSLY